MVVIARRLLEANKFSCVFGSMVNRWLLLYDGCHRQVSLVVSMVIGKQVVVIVRWLP